jgi:hypothetical protein
MRRLNKMKNSELVTDNVNYNYVELKCCVWMKWICRPSPSLKETSDRKKIKNSTFLVVWRCILYHKVKSKADPLQAWSGPEGSRKLRFPDFMTTAQDGGKVVSLTHQPPLPQEIHLVIISVRGWIDPRAIVRTEGLCHRKMSMTPSGI